MAGNVLFQMLTNVEKAQTAVAVRVVCLIVHHSAPTLMVHMTAAVLVDSRLTLMTSHALVSI